MTPLPIFFLIIPYLISKSECLNVLQISPGWSNSHVLFNYRLSKTLTDRGHNVTLLIPLLTDKPPSSKPPKGVDVIFFHLLSRSSEAERALGGFQNMAFQKPKLSFFFFVTVTFRELARTTGDQILSNYELMEKLSQKNFHITLAHPFDLWPVGLSNRLKIDKFVWIAPGAFLLDHTYWIMGLPNIPSLSPNLMGHSADRMDFGERIKNSILWLIGCIFNHIDDFLPRSEGSVYKKPPYHTEADTNLRKVVERTRAIFINGESALDIARPMVPGMFYLGDMEHKKINPLSQDWQQIVDSSKSGLILFSFGTIANTSLMPLELKDAFLTAFSKFPDYTILWRLEGQMPDGLNRQKHVKIVKWIPQRDLLFNPKMKLFITHGGYNSLLESSQAGVPMVLMPLFADQPANARKASHLGIGITLNKFSLTAGQIEHAIRTVLNDQSFGKNAHKLSSVLKDHIMDNQLMAMRQIERVASEKRFWPTMSAAQKLNLFQYLCLDVIALLSIAVAVTIWLVYAVVITIWRMIQDQKAKQKKNV